MKLKIVEKIFFARWIDRNHNIDVRGKNSNDAFSLFKTIFSGSAIGRRIYARRFWKISRLGRFSRFNSWELSFGGEAASRKMGCSYFREERGLSPWPQRDHYRAIYTTALSSFPGGIATCYPITSYMVYLVSSFPPRRRWIRSQIHQGC